ncbi:YigZ family protein [Vagococcus xieshaowenii]|uniref:YigZ family protein n=1 Tax=Vagococcus xieshaowenii TaxID=2562451 RepID=A0AAJ5EH18_9ENTE|nr:YigZ family protein [Vagococcus xieshaowenii]QCA28791.1 YigZ family protein [Vagococcus xieshaowenii]TFZ43008.1 YigZ family protein [Vagococcus xieshaowenii]
MTNHYITIKEDGIHEIDIKKSRFITQLVRIESEEQAREIIQQTKKEHWKANHNCSAYVLGNKQEIQRSSDDGEPSGTAGVPMLEVLKKQDIINTLTIVTRYFGGTKLGAGGLIRAYSSAVSEAVLAIGLVKGTLRQEIMLTIDYSQHSTLEYFLTQHQYAISETTFTEKVTVHVMVNETEVTTFEEAVTNLLNGQIQLTLGDTNYFEEPINAN